jgi:hypothetical protein
VPAKRKRGPAKAAMPVGETYSWAATIDGGYTFNPVDAVLAVLTPVEEKWAMLVQIGGKRYTGQRATLEDAFKATDALLFREAKNVWTKSLCGVVLAPWAHTLPED